jgi:signal transduction histidine kinase
MSLQTKLPLMMATILVVVLATSLALTYRALTNAAESALAERVASVAQQLGAMLENGMRARTAQLERVAREPLVIAAVRRPAGTPLPPAELDSVHGLLARLRTGADSAMPVVLWTADGRRAASVGPSVAIDLQGESHVMPRPGDDAPVGGEGVRYSPFFRGGASTAAYYHATLPIRVGAQTVGYLVLMRRIGGAPQAAAQFSTLLGEDITLYLHNADGTAWTPIGEGLPTDAPQRLDSNRVVRDRIGELYTAGAKITGTPWIVSLEAPIASARRTPRAILLSLGLVGLLLTVAGALVAWGMGRRVTQPIAQLTAAAEAISRGDYRSHVGEHGEQEVVRLARSFNRMASEVAVSHRALATQYAEARNVAGELETAYAALQNAMCEVEEARDSAETANRAKSDFLAVMSHELRTPLNAIGGYVQLMQMGIHGPVTEAQMQALTRIARSHKHLLGLINDVLNFARLGAGQVEYDIRDVSLDDALTSVEAMVEPQIEAKGLVYTRAACAPGLAARADADKLQQIVVNLLSNAVKFTPNGGSVDIDCRSVDDSVEVVVRDTGIGIPADRLRAIFEPFVQVNRALNRPHEGVGLGLAISGDLARGMGGEIRAESVPGEGSVFVLRLPAARSMAGQQVAATAG